MTPSPRVPVVLCFDVEPDENLSPPGRPSPWQGFERLIEMVAPLRDRVFAATGEPPHFSWFLRLDPEIGHTYGSQAWVVGRYESFFHEAARDGDALGLHTHMARWDPRAAHWVLDLGDSAWVEDCLTSSFETFRSAFGRPAAVHRFGDNWLGAEALRLLNSLGVTCDLSVLPGVSPEPPPGSTWTGSYPDLEDAPQAPYHPGFEDPARPVDAAADRLWELPLTTVPAATGRRRLPRLARRARHPVRTIVNGLNRVLDHSSGPDRSRPQRRETLAPERDWRSGRDFWDAAARRLSELDQPYLAFPLRSHFTVRSRLLSNVQRVVDDLVATPLALTLSFTTAEDALQRLRRLD